MFDVESLTPQQQSYLRLVEEGAPSVTYAAKRSGVRPTDVWNWRKQVEGFSQHEKRLWDVARDVIRDEVRRRALYGNQRVVLVNGQPLPMRNPTTGEIMLDEDFNPMWVTVTEVSDRMLELDARVTGLLKEEGGVKVSVEDGAEGQAPGKVTIEIVRSDGNGGFMTEEL